MIQFDLYSSWLIHVMMTERQESSELPYGPSHAEASLLFSKERKVKDHAASLTKTEYELTGMRSGLITASRAVTGVDKTPRKVMVSIQQFSFMTSSTLS